MKKDEGFYFIPKKWLGDANVISMDWDCKGMHLHLMAIAWQQPLQGYIIDDENLILKVLGNPDKKDWEERIRPQIFRAWKKKSISQDGIEKNYWYQLGVIKTIENISEIKPRKSRKIVNKTVEDSNDFAYPGFDLKTILNENFTSTILHEKPNEVDKITIWNLGVSLVKKQNESEGQARAFLAKLIKQYGEKTVAGVIAEISVKNIKPAEIHSYITGMLKIKVKEQETGNKQGSGRGRVVL